MSYICQACKKQSATVHLTDITPQGEKSERHLCEECAQREGVTPKPQNNLHLKHLLSAFVEGGKVTAQQIAELTCQTCGLTFVEFRNTGLLGCPGDYDAFEKALVPLIERAHQGASHHIGKIPHRLGTPRAVENDLIRLRRELDHAVDSEQFEQAARIRDRIRTIEES
ncbi:MAG: UvrB/UvrC motif-containing protein [Phycisphaerae bacterium]